MATRVLEKSTHVPNVSETVLETSLCTFCSSDASPKTSVP